MTEAPQTKVVVGMTVFCIFVGLYLFSHPRRPWMGRFIREKHYCTSISLTSQLLGCLSWCYYESFSERGTSETISFCVPPHGTTPYNVSAPVLCRRSGPQQTFLLDAGIIGHGWPFGHPASFEKNATMHAAEPRDCPCRSRAPQKGWS